MLTKKPPPCTRVGRQGSGFKADDTFSSRSPDHIVFFYSRIKKYISVSCNEHDLGQVLVLLDKERVRKQVYSRFLHKPKEVRSYLVIEYCLAIYDWLVRDR